MIAGHFATALIPYAKERQAPLWIFLLGGLSLDVVLAVFVLVGIEKVALVHDMAGGIFNFGNYESMMTYSHDLLPVLGWTLLVSIIVWLIYRNVTWALWSGGLIVLHEVFDWLSGYEHYVFGPDSPVLGFGLYETNFITALLVEITLTVLILVYFFVKRGGEYTLAKKTGISLVLLLPTIALLILQFIFV